MINNNIINDWFNEKYPNELKNKLEIVKDIIIKLGFNKFDKNNYINGFELINNFNKVCKENEFFTNNKTRSSLFQLPRFQHNDDISTKNITGYLNSILKKYSIKIDNKQIRNNGYRESVYYINNLNKIETVDKPIDIVNKRAIIEYNDKELWEITNRINMVKLDIEYIEHTVPIYDNQLLAAHQIITNFQDRQIINQMVLGKTQSGKTGAMLAAIKIFIKNNNIPINNIYIITGLSSIEWKEQTKERLPLQLNNRVFHRSDLKKFNTDIVNKQNVLIIMDEMHIAAKINMTIHKVFSSIGLLNQEYLLKNDIKILEFTATPEGTIFDLFKWGVHSCKLKINTGLGYIGAIDLLSNNQVKQFKSLYYNDTFHEKEIELVKKNIKELLDIIESYNEPRYHIIRTKTGTEHDITIINISIITNNKYDTIIYDAHNEENINTFLSKPPNKHTLIFIKEKLRCAKTLDKSYLGVLYERCVECVDDTVITQGLMGRLTGYHNNDSCICFTNIESIKKYEALWDHDFNSDVFWKSKTTKKGKNGKTTSLKTFNSGFDTIKEEAKEDIIQQKVNIFKSRSQQNVIDFVKNNLNSNITKLIKSNDGYYRSYFRGFDKICLYDEIIKGKRYGLNLNKNKYKYYACYKDINDKSTLRFLVCYYPDHLIKK